MSKQWLKTLAEHYPSLIVSGVCHKALAHIEAVETERDELREMFYEARRYVEHKHCSKGTASILRLTVKMLHEEIEELDRRLKVAHHAETSLENSK